MSERIAPTLDDVARAAGVSRATASRVINGVVPVSRPAADAVRKALSIHEELVHVTVEVQTPVQPTQTALAA